MSNGSALRTLATLIIEEREPLLVRWRAQVRELPSAAHLDTATLNDHIPYLLDELATALRQRSDETIADALLEGTPPEHGVQRFHDGFEIEEVVAEYNILRGCLHDLGDAAGLTFQGAPFHIMNRVFDSAIGLAVQAYATQRLLEVQQRRQEHLTFVAHDLRTPLTAISLAVHYLERVLPDAQPADATARMLKTLRRNVQTLQALVSQVVTANSTGDPNVPIEIVRRQLDLWPLVEGLIDDLQPVSGTGNTRLVNEVPEDTAIYADAELLRRVLQNLLSNAITYTPRGEVVVGARVDDERNGTLCWVSDNGAGIPADKIELVFDKFETDRERQGGVGLGLAIVKQYVEAHGGEVTVESTLGNGSLFRVFFPNR